ncbi:MAG: phosphoethanolamine--lipid A transferase [Alcanivorax sp.]|nr:phosphoethanolamine--lipid A transferase [Alcanivorax sp.]
MNSENSQGRSPRALSPLLLAALTALFLLMFANVSLWRGTLHGLGHDLPGLVVLAIALFLLLTGLIHLLLWRWTAKPVVIFLLLVAAPLAYFMDTYGTYIDTGMVRNAVETDTREVLGLMSWQLLAYFALIGVIPSLLVAWLPLKVSSWPRMALAKLLVFPACLLLSVGLIWSDYQQLSSFGRNNRPLRYLINPVMPLYYTYRYFREQQLANMPMQPLGRDARKGPRLDGAKQGTLVVMVVGETARAADFSLNGYQRDTNPQLARRDVINYPQASSCGTETAVSLPCMFSVYDRDNYDHQKAVHTENLLDVLKHAGITVAWRDNNSGDKGVADRVDYQELWDQKVPGICNGDRCFDDILLHNLQAYLDKHVGQDVFLVLHQEGSHGPSYYLRYPQEFARFKPECKTKKLDQCSHQEIINAYDNTILYTDHVLARVIDLLKQNQSQFNTAMLYMSDHGESTGEGGMYLHGMPYMIAPQTQKHIPYILWLSPAYRQAMSVNESCLRQRSDQPVSQDNLFSTVLGMFDIQTTVYRQNMDFIQPCRGD